MQTVSERSAWIRRGWEDARKRWLRDIGTIPKECREDYMVGWRRGVEENKRGREQG